MNTAATRGEENVHTRGRGGTGSQGPIPIKTNPRTKTRKRRPSGSRSQVPPWRAALEPCTKLRVYTLTPRNRRACRCGAEILVGVFGSTFFFWCVNGIGQSGNADYSSESLFYVDSKQSRISRIFPPPSLFLSFFLFLFLPFSLFFLSFFLSFSSYTLT